MIVHDAKKTRLTLDQPLARGGEGTIHTVTGRPDLLAKLYHAPSPTVEAKLAWMVAHPPADPTAARGHVSIAWPRALLFDAKGTCVGYLMPRIKDAVPLLTVFNPRLRAKVLPGFDWRYLHRTARNLASGLGALHERDYVVGDVNEGNILVSRTALVTLIDTDSFQVRAQDGGAPVVYSCPVGKPEYTAPELQGQPFAQVVRRPEHDNFALGVLIFQLLLEGNHPFRGRWLEAGDAPSQEEKIRRGDFPHQRPASSRVAPPPGVPPVSILHPEVAFLVQRCFVDGYRNPARRPTPAEWAAALKRAEGTLIECAQGHHFGNHVGLCPWCGAPRRSGPAPRAAKSVSRPAVSRDTPASAKPKPATPPPTPPALPAPAVRRQPSTWPQAVAAATLISLVVWALLQGWALGGLPNLAALPGIGELGLTASDQPRRYPIADAWTGYGNGVEEVYDGDPTTYWLLKGRQPPGTTNITLSLGEVVPIGVIRWRFAVAGSADVMRVYVSLDGRNWTLLDRIEDAGEVGWQQRSADVSAAFVRFNFTNPNHEQAIGGLAEVEIWAPGNPPAPAESERRAADPEPTAEPDPSQRIGPRTN